MSRKTTKGARVTIGIDFDDGNSTKMQGSSVRRRCSKSKETIVFIPDSLNEGRRKREQRKSQSIVFVPRGLGGPPGDMAPPSDHENQANTDSEVFDLIDGRYAGGNSRLALELRVDFKVSGVISGDLFGTRFGRRDFLASFRTAPGIDVDDDYVLTWPAIFESQTTEVVQGSIRLDQSAVEDVLTVTLFVDGRLPGLPAREGFVISADWQGEAMRVLGIELEKETGTQDPPAYGFDERPMTVGQSFRDAGIELVAVGDQSRIPREESGWGGAQLHTLMMEWANADLNTSEWRQQLLWLGHPSRSGLLGIMFDTTALLPRQGTAVFDQEIRRIVTDEPDRKVIQTAVHEIGHGLNLAHRFEREVGHADSTSFMNYDWKYKGGNRRREFWDEFNFSFDPDELEFLRHAPRHQIIPGGAPFHSVNYWKNGSGGYVPYAPEDDLDIVNLSIEPPLGGPILSFGQPVFLKVTLTNTSGQDLSFDNRLLDPKGDFLQITVRKIEPGGAQDRATHFHPIVERCMDVGLRDIKPVPNGKSISENIQITFGTSGFAFAEPGRYEVQVFGSIFAGSDDANPFNDQELIAASNTLILHIAHPQSREEEVEVVDVLLRDDVGVYFALGGSRALSDASSDLKAVLENRMHGLDNVDDPIAACILRCQGIDKGRRYRRFASGHFRATDGDPIAAAEILTRLGDAAMRAFDAETRMATNRLLQKHKDKASERS